MADTYTELLEHLTEVLANAPEVEGAAVIGSRAGSDADAGADLDVVLFAADPAGLASDVRWLSPLGRVWATTLDNSLAELPVRRVLLEGAIQLDLLTLSTDGIGQLAGGARRVLSDMARRGFETVKAGGPVPEALAALAGEAARPARPSQEEFAELVSRFWIDVVRAARRLSRGEVWSALRITDGPLKDAMVQMQSWIVKALKGGDFDTYWDGRRLGEWAGARFERDLQASFATFEAESVRAALIETMDLFRLQAIQAAQRWSLDYPETLDRRTTVWVRTLE
ncbi:MAG: aminoglycoside 6-adenylyltransferase [Bifidobacteriaceae bacterium]|nr:aminoglycoside 6-adenylyltransferase [Bifidobacteriaceae bacterium]